MPGVFPARTGYARWYRSGSTASVRAPELPTERAGCSGRCLARRCAAACRKWQLGADCSRASAGVLGGDKAKGQQIFDSVTSSKKVEESDWFRIGRVYAEAGEWPKAREAFDRALASKPNDDSGMLEYGAYTNVLKDRAKAEELFLKAFKKNSREFWHWVGAGGSSLGVSFHSNVVADCPEKLGCWIEEIDPRNKFLVPHWRAWPVPHYVAGLVAGEAMVSTNPLGSLTSNARAPHSVSCGSVVRGRQRAWHGRRLHRCCRRPRCTAASRPL